MQAQDVIDFVQPATEAARQAATVAHNMQVMNSTKQNDLKQKSLWNLMPVKPTCAPNECLQFSAPFEEQTSMAPWADPYQEWLRELGAFDPIVHTSYKFEE